MIKHLILLFLLATGALGQVTQKTPVTLDGNGRVNYSLKLGSGKTLTAESGSTLTLSAGSTFGFFGSSVTDASTFRTAAGLGIGSAVQAYDADLTTLAGSTAFFLSLADDADAATARTTLGLAIGTDVQAYDADLANIATLSTTAFGRGLLDDADAATARRTVGAPSTATGLLIVEGDSLSTGAQWSPTIAALHPTWTVLNQATGGERIDQMSTSYASTTGAARHYSRAREKNIIVLWAGTNDITAGASAATIQSRFTTYINAAEATGFQIVVTTILPAASWSGGQETIRQTANTWLRTNHPSKLADIANVTGFINQSDASNLTNFSDGTHLTAAAYTTLVPVIETAVNALPAIAPTVGTLAAQDALNFGPVAVVDSAHAISIHRAGSYAGVLLKFVDAAENFEGGIGHVLNQQWWMIGNTFGGQFDFRSPFDGSSLLSVSMVNGAYENDVRVGLSSPQQMAGVGGTISTNTTTVGNVGSGEDTLQTNTIGASWLHVNGYKIAFVYTGTIANNAAAKRLRLKWGATTIFDTGASGITPSVGMDYRISGEITRTGGTTQKCSVQSVFGVPLSGVPSVDYTTASETLSGAVNLVFTGEGTNDNDVTKESGWLEFKR